jgi:hypothetical protein
LRNRVPRRRPLSRDLKLEDVRFGAGTPVDFRYGFDFYRISYLCDILHRYAKNAFGLGASLQLRDAVIGFTAADGSLRYTRCALVPVPALKSRGRRYPTDTGWVGFESDGMYAPVKYFNGGDSDVEGASLDVRLRGGYELAPPVGLFLNLRCLGGGAKGSSEPNRNDQVWNYLQFITLSLGIEVALSAYRSDDERTTMNARR